MADALSRKNHVKLFCAQVQSNIQYRIAEAQRISASEGKIHLEMACGAERQLETKHNGLLYYLNRIWVPDRNSLRIFLLDEAHKY